MINREELALWTIIEMRWPILAEHLSKHPNDINIVTTKKLPNVRKFNEELKFLLTSDEVQRVVEGNAQNMNCSLTVKDIAE